MQQSGGFMNSQKKYLLIIHNLPDTKVDLFSNPYFIYHSRKLCYTQCGLIYVTIKKEDITLFHE